MDSGLAHSGGAEVLHVNKGLGNGIGRLDSAASSLCSLANSSSQTLSRTSTGEFSTGDCFSLICTEDVLDESLGPSGGEALAPMAQFCGQDVGYCSPAPEFSPTGTSEVFIVIRQDLQKQREMARRPDCGRKPACAPRATALSASAATSPQLPATHSEAADRCAVSGCCCCCPSSAAAAAPLRLPSAHRSRIVGWMRHVAEALGLHLATLFAAGSLLDRFVAASEDLPPDSMLQLLAIACMSVAVKYEEVGQVAPCVWLRLAVDCQGKAIYQAQDLQRMEWVLLQALHWRLHVPNTYSFLSHFLLCLPHAAPAPAAGPPPKTAAAARDADADACHATPAPAAPAAPQPTRAPGVAQWLPVTSRAVMLAEMSLLNDCFLGYDHSTIALACVALAERMLGCASDAAAAGLAPAAGAAAAMAAAATGTGFGTAFASCGCGRPASVCALSAGVVGAGATAAAAAVSAAAGVWVGALAPGLEACAVTLRHCQVQEARRQAEEAAAKAAAARQQLHAAAWCGMA
ncbi:hypothetical protein CHLRE_11g467772v5 [Chlamydomonas reinhardtii]|uniref:Cyclin-like domain-containing protein n=1 Tax=Chlamydomonas reinhardtii TaxID=3055 RepID=A0A2K3D7Z0_CHLRE|nr:uncharacterized protein CHLRE_11g467772v5 [Chlamydomonas reinhardtii]PNW76652.1 hypothetical protein CHLRE_11g467772v5 [Chlamydomonas reinhardtii]